MKFYKMHRKQTNWLKNIVNVILLVIVCYLIAVESLSLLNVFSNYSNAFWIYDMLCVHPGKHTASISTQVATTQPRGIEKKGILTGNGALAKFNIL